MILNDTAIERAIYDEPQGDTSKFAATKANPFLVAALSGSQSKAPGFAGGYLLTNFEGLSFPRIISARIYDASRTRLAW